MSKYARILGGLVKTCRPKQLVTKNIMIFVPLLFTPLYLWTSEAGKLFVMIVIIALCAGSVYLMNDAIDCDRDALHPTKRNRPIASGLVPKPLAYFSSGVFMTLALGISAWLEFDALIATTVYLIVATGYTLLLKHTPVMDVIALGSFYAIRISAGFAVTTFSYGRTFEICIVMIVWLGAIALGLTKRLTEVQTLGNNSETRSVLTFYEVGRIEVLFQMAQSGVLPLLAIAGFIIELPLWLIVPGDIIAFFVMNRYWIRTKMQTEDLHPQEVIYQEISSWIHEARSFAHRVSTPSIR